ncbi:hypothetical protein F53441_1099 [Fusarium austroafricanum]|uniref:Uncharacterized protein n=1 Tax=Fusarium austroafricanum TaxID=2364996 RepID=A0A8H4P4G2_9HYPO|nr:hypothetical protein F53441_1099 [Fusarium austroafricanum]
MEDSVKTSTDLTPPSEEESKIYYGNWNSKPKLVARSNSAAEPWDGKPNGLDPVSRHAIVPLWNGDSPICEDVIKEIQNLKFVAIDIFRIGPN